MAKIDQILKLLPEHNASDLHMVPGDPPIVRLNGVMRRTSLDVLTSEFNKSLLYEIMDADQIASFENNNDIDMSYEIKGVSRYRGNIFRQNNGVCAVFRMIPSQVFSCDELGVSETIRNFTYLKSGLVLVTGPTGSGKSTTLAALIDLINTDRRLHIITIEDPLEFVHEEKQSIISHREVGRHTRSFANALRAAMREDPDVILVGEMRDLETISLAITAAEMGILVFGTLHTNSAPKTINRIIDVFPENQQEQIRTMLASSLKGIIAQQLLKRKDKKGRVAVHEVLVVNPGVANLIREGKSHQISSIMETSKQEGNCTMDQSLSKFVMEKVISAREAYRKALNKSIFEKMTEQEEEITEAVSVPDDVDEILQVDISLNDTGDDMKNFLQNVIESQHEQDASKATVVLPNAPLQPVEQDTEKKLDIVKSDAIMQNEPTILKPREPEVNHLSQKSILKQPAPSILPQQPKIKEKPKSVDMEAFQDKLEQTIAVAAQSGSGGILIIVEMEGLEAVLQSGACSLSEINDVFSQVLSGSDCFSQATPEVYVILCPGMSAGEKSKQIHSGLCALLNGKNVAVRVGDAAYPNEAATPDDLIDQASQIKYC
ncbi:MAG: type IV pilus twitching motility protein PilT [Candidatus Auribacterota bacterium]